VSAGLPPDCSKDFEVRKVLGQGGAGTVYLCEQRTLGRLAAVKVMRRAAGADPVQAQRFIREARIAASLKHPHVVALLDFGCVTEPWIAFELVEGPTLRQRLQERPLTPHEALDLGIQVAAALELAHAQGVVHRDLKPDNVLEARPGHWKVADFGIAHCLADDIGKPLTAEGTLMGTPEYIAPEYVSTGRVSPGIDCYALAATLFEALTGMRPIRGSSPGEILRNLITVVPEPASALRPDLPPQIDRLLEQALRKEPEDRFADATALRLALESVRRSLAGSKRPGRESRAAPPSASRSVAPSRIGAWSVAATLVAVCLIAAWTARDRPREIAPPPRSPSPPASAAALFSDEDRHRTTAAIDNALQSLRRCESMKRMEQGLIGGKLVANAAELEKPIATVLDRVADLVEALPRRRVSIASWCWAAWLIQEVAESMRYFPEPPHRTSLIGRASARLQELASRAPRETSRVFEPLTRTALACALKPGAAADRDAANACAAAHGEVARWAAAAFRDPAEQPLVLTVLTWRRLQYHGRGFGKKDSGHEAVLAGMLENGERLLDALPARAFAEFEHYGLQMTDLAAKEVLALPAAPPGLADRARRVASRIAEVFSRPAARSP
jgi:serine/threonine protein kinase